MDYFYPKPWDGSNNDTIHTRLDACLGAIGDDNMYHYWFIPPCIFDSSALQTWKYCDEIDQCSTDMTNYAQAPFDALASKTLIGIAKDGHEIIGPYKDDGSTFNCKELDICNGYEATSESTYYYVGVNTFPYLVGCYGPGAHMRINPLCSRNACAQAEQLIISIILALGIISCTIF